MSSSSAPPAPRHLKPRAWAAVVAPVLLAIVSVLAGTSPAAAQSSESFSVWADSDQPSSLWHTPNRFGLYTGGRVVVYRNWAGGYTVRFPGVNMSDGSAQVSSTGAAEHCSTTRWFGELVGVECFDSTGRNVDSTFRVSFSNNPNRAWVWNDRGSQSGSYTPNARYSNNPAGGAVTIARNYEGGYTVRFAGYEMERRRVQVTTYGSNAVCSVSNKVDDLVGVECRAPDGSLTDARFTARAIVIVR